MIAKCFTFLYITLKPLQCQAGKCRKHLRWQPWGIGPFLEIFRLQNALQEFSMKCIGFHRKSLPWPLLSEMINSSQGGICSEHSWPGSICWCCSGRIHLPLVKTCKNLPLWYTKGFRDPQKPTLHFKNDFEKYNNFYMFYFILIMSGCGVLFSILLLQLSGTHQTLYLHRILYSVRAKLSALRFRCNDFSSVCSLELDRNCQPDFTAVYDGPTTDSGLLGKVCGCAQPTFESSSNMMTTVLSTEDSNSYRGFSAQYSSVPLLGPVEPNSECTWYMEGMLILFMMWFFPSKRTDGWHWGVKPFYW